jgi:hypothetical protein
MKVTNDIKSAVDTAEIFNRAFAQVSASIEFLNGIIVSLPPTFSTIEDDEAVLNCLEALHRIKKRCNQDALREHIKKM